MVHLLDGENSLNIYIYSFDIINERNKQTDRRTPHDAIGRAIHSVALQKV